MASFRQNIIEQVMAMPVGRIFSFHDLDFEIEKSPLVAVYLSNLVKNNTLKKFEKGAYYRPKISSFGLGTLSVREEDKLDYLARKYDGYITGAEVYNRLGLTEQVAMSVTLATPNNVRNFKMGNLKVNCVKAYSNAYKDKEKLYYVWILDAVKDIKNVPETSEQKIYDRLKFLHLKNMNLDNLTTLVDIAQSYPPRVRQTIADMMGDLSHTQLEVKLRKGILPSTRFNINYKRKVEYVN